MSLKKIKLITITMVLCSVFLGCRKKSLEYDYVSKFLGEYKAIVHYSAYATGNYITDTVYEVNMTITKGQTNKQIYIYTNQNFGFAPDVLEDGTLVFTNYNYPSGKFIDQNTIYILYGNSWPGGHWTSELIGKKINK